MKNGGNTRTGRLCWFFLVSCLALGVALTACGRRADPVHVPDYEEEAVGKTEDERAPTTDALPDDGGSAEEKQPPVRPSGVSAVFTGKSVILTWDEITGQGVRLYRIYRSAGGDYELVGDSAAPAYTDTEIRMNMHYFYRIVAVGAGESRPSEEIEVITEIY